MAFKIGNGSGGFDEAILDSRAIKQKSWRARGRPTTTTYSGPNNGGFTDIHNMNNWSTGSEVSHGGAGSWSAVTHNLRTSSVQPTTDDWAEAIVHIYCDYMQLGAFSWTGSTTMEFGTASKNNITIDDAAVNVKVNSRIIVYIQNIATAYTSANNRPAVIIQSWQTFDAGGSFMTTWNNPARMGVYNSSGGSSGNSQSAYSTKHILDPSFRWTTDTVKLNLPTMNTTNARWKTKMWWR